MLPKVFLHGVGVGAGENICALPDGNSPERDPDPKPPEAAATDAQPSAGGKTPRSAGRELAAQHELWFAQWWAEFWLRKAKKPASDAFRKTVLTEELFQQVIAATRAQKAEMMAREAKHRPHGATWLNDQRWLDEPAEAKQNKNDDYPEF